MLVQFSTANYRSFRDKATVSFVAAKDPTHPENVFHSRTKPSLDLLKSLAMYGANASGKTNFIKAIEFMRSFVLNSATKFQQGDEILIAPFKLDQCSASEPSLFEVVFIKNGERYAYGFTADKHRVHEEWLTAATVTRPRVLFERSSEYANGYKFGAKWRGEALRISERTRDNALFLSVGVQFGHTILQPVFDWFKNDIRGISNDPETGSENDFTVSLIADYPDWKSQVINLLKHADTGIEDIVVEKVPLSEVRPWAGMPESVMRAFVSDFNLGSEANRMKTLHMAPNWSKGGHIVEFDFDDESGGTKRLFALAGPLLYVLRNGCTLFVDEIDIRLHPLLTRMLIHLFNDPKMNPNNAQIMFTTHDCSILDKDIFRRDQIWFTEKDRSGATDLYSLSDYKPRKDENFRSGYLKGKYGAIPFIGDMSLEQNGAA